jgi:PAS domain S-box-containing protein
MVDTAREAEPGSRRHDAIVQAVALAAERLLRSPDWREAIDEVLARLGSAADVSRAYVVENRVDPDGDLRTWWLAEWTAPGIVRVSDDAAFATASWAGSGFGRWAASLERGEPITGDVPSFLEQERRVLEAHGVRSLASFPLTVEGRWWGAVGFDDCTGSRDWLGPDGEILRTAATLIGAAIERQLDVSRLRATEARYRSVVEQIPAVTYFDIVEPDGVRLGFVSPQIGSLLGYPYERFLAEPDFWFTLIHPDDEPRIDEAARASGSAFVPFDQEYRMRHADGRWIWVHDSTTPVHGEDGELTHFQGFLVDVTARREAEERVREAEARYRAVVEGIPAASYIDEPADVAEGMGARVTYISPQIEALLGMAPQRFLDEPGLWFQLMHPDDYARLEARGAFDVRDETPFDEEYRMRHADGRWIWVRDTSIAIYHGDGTLAYFQGFMVDVTARVEAEQRRTEAEARYRSVVESIAAVTYVEEPAAADEGATARMTFVSPQIERLTGIAAERFIADQRLWFTLMHPDDLAALRASGTMTAAHTGPWDAEYRLRGPDGTWVWVHDSSVGIYSADGTLSHFQGFLVDVTARHDAEDRLRRAQERFRILVEQMPAIVYTERVEDGSTRAAETDYVSPGAEAILGYPAQAWMDDVDFWARVVHPDDALRVDDAMEHVNATGDPLSIDYRVFAADGRTVWFHEEAILIRDEDGRPVYWQGLMVDATDRIMAGEQVRQAEARFRMIVEHTPAITYQAMPTTVSGDRLANLIYVSPQAERILGYPSSRWLEGPGFWMQVTHPDDLERVIDVSVETNRSGEPYSADYRMIAADGRALWFHDEAELIRDAAGAPVVWQGVMYDVTDRMQAEEQLRLARARLQAMIEHIPAAVYLEGPVPTAGSFYISPQVEELFGYTAEEWTWTDDFWIDRIHPDDRARVEADERASDENRGRHTSEYRFRRSDGRYVWVHDEAAWVGDGDEGFWQGFLYDITDRKEAEEQVAAAERVLRATVEHLPAVVYREPPDREAPGAEMWLSPRLVDLVGYTPEEWRTEGPHAWSQHVHPEERARVAAANEHANATKEPFAEDYRMRRRDGTYVWVHDEATFVEGLDGTGWWQGFLLDVTASKEAQQALQAGEAKFRAIVEQSPAVIYTQEFDADAPSVSRTTYISPRQDEVFGYTSEEMLADPTLWARTIHPEDRERVLSADVDSNTAASDAFTLEYRMIAKDGRVVWVQDQANLVRVEGQAPFWQGFLLDITERKHAEEQLARALDVEREATRSLRALDEMKNTFLQAVSHDLRTPLAAILGLAITLERGDVHLEEEDAKDLARRIAGNARRLDRLVANLLDLDRLARGIVTPKLQSIDVGTLVQRVLAESELISDARLEVDIEPVQIPVDAAKVERIVENLVANSVRHTPEDSSVLVRVRAEDGGCLIVVEDDGPGVPAELRDAVFEPFRQGADVPQHSPGVGVGLALVRRFAELHGGRAWVEDREGGGASFRVFLPAPGHDADPTDRSA